MTKGIRTKSQIDAATEPAAKARASYLHSGLRDKLPHFANLRDGELAKTGGLSFWQVVLIWGVAGGLMLIAVDPLGIL